jgi:uncharacterized protein (DUF2267 family)
MVSGARWGAKRLKTKLAEQKTHHGRKKGAVAVTDEQILEELKPWCFESSRFCLRRGTPMQTLSASISTIAAKTPELGIKYRRLCQRLQAQRLGVSKSTHRTDVCELCAHFDHVIAAELTVAWRELREKFADHSAKYLDEIGEAATFALDRASEIQKICAAVEKACSDEASPELVAAASAELPKWQGHLSCMEAFGFHWDLNTKLKAAYLKDLDAPEPGVAYLTWDFEDRQRNKNKLLLPTAIYACFSSVVYLFLAHVGLGQPKFFV